MLNGEGLNNYDQTTKGLGMPATKADDGKLRLDLIPPEIITALGDILSFGASKYAPRNWEKGLDWGRIYAALQRHLWAWWNLEDKDSETGRSHLWHAACCITFLVAYEQRGIGTDSRPRPKDIAGLANQAAVKGLQATGEFSDVEGPYGEPPKR